jgi:hypothetical protein
MIALRSHHRSLSTFLSIGVLLAASACTDPDTTGAEGNATFGYGSFGQSLAQPMAAGASTTMSVTTNRAVAAVQSSDPSILSVGSLTGSVSQGFSVPLAARRPGSVTVAVYDGSGSEIDYTTVVVAPVTGIALDQGVTSGLTVLANEQAFAVHGTVKGSGGVTLVGDGSVQFSYQGALAQSDDVGLCIGDCGAFWAPVPGDGQVVLSTSTATTTLVVHAIAASAVDSIAFQPSSLDLTLSGAGAKTAGGWPYTLSAAGAVVYGTGIQCTSSDESIAIVAVNLFGPSLGGATTGSVGVGAVAPGSATVTCSMNAATPYTWTVPVTVH